MKKIFAVALLTAIILLAGCGSEKPVAQTVESSTEEDNPAPVAPPLKTITRAEAEEKLSKLSNVLEVRYDDMKEITFCRVPVDSYLHPSIWIIPYVAIDKNYNAELRHKILYVGNEPLFFETLYVKTSGGVETFQYKDVVKGSVGEEYDGRLSYALYKKLQEGIKTRQAKFRLSGRTFGERELTEEELVDMEELFAAYEFFKSVKVVN